ncbi:MAG TPA: hypothetical protein VFB92_17020 [Vicinamibacterales bacterium]|jgi:hypothetical protein|nr:hypothetical protein [Vicinamibacterales bacterium]
MTAIRGFGLVALAGFLLMPSTLSAQDSKSAAVAGELTRLLDEMKLDAVAAKHGTDRFVAALYFQGSQLLVVAAKYSVPERMNQLIGQKQYRDVYADLSSASEQATKVFVMDLGANGLKFKRENNEPFDTVDSSGGSVAFNGERGKLSEDDYRKAFSTSDEQYTSMLQALLAALKKPS